jgi:hypothetical protein
MPRQAGLSSVRREANPEDVLSGIGKEAPAISPVTKPRESAISRPFAPEKLTGAISSPGDIISPPEPGQITIPSYSSTSPVSKNSGNPASSNTTGLGSQIVSGISELFGGGGSLGLEGGGGILGIGETAGVSNLVWIAVAVVAGYFLLRS